MELNKNQNLVLSYWETMYPVIEEATVKHMVGHTTPDLIIHHFISGYTEDKLPKDVARAYAQVVSGSGDNIQEMIEILQEFINWTKNYFKLEGKHNGVK